MEVNFSYYNHTTTTGSLPPHLNLLTLLLEFALTKTRRWRRSCGGNNMNMAFTTEDQILNLSEGIYCQSTCWKAESR